MVRQSDRRLARDRRPRLAVRRLLGRHRGIAQPDGPALHLPAGLGRRRGDRDAGSRAGADAGRGRQSPQHRRRPLRRSRRSLARRPHARRQRPQNERDGRGLRLHPSRRRGRRLGRHHLRRRGQGDRRRGAVLWQEHRGDAVRSHHGLQRERPALLRRLVRDGLVQRGGQLRRRRSGCAAGVAFGRRERAAGRRGRKRVPRDQAVLHLQPARQRGRGVRLARARGRLGERPAGGP